jgi:hypothetical protein
MSGWGYPALPRPAALAQWGKWQQVRGCDRRHARRAGRPFRAKASNKSFNTFGINKADEFP